MPGASAADPVAIIGHRGARGLFAENTLEGFRRTAALGVDAIELDVGLSADGVVMVHHDPCLNPALTRLPDGTYLRSPGPALTSLPAAVLEGYDVGRIDPHDPLTAAWPTQLGFDGARIPRLAAVLAALPDMRFVIELKSRPQDSDDDAAPWPNAIALAAATLHVCDAAAGGCGRAVIQSFDLRGLLHLRNQRRELPLVWLTQPATPAIAAEVAALGLAGWAPEQAGVTPAAVAHAHALGVRVTPWTVNDPTRMRQLIAAGVDGLITDRPDLARIAGAGSPAVRGTT